jgi:hypothetical protein
LKVLKGDTTLASKITIINLLFLTSINFSFLTLAILGVHRRKETEKRRREEGRGKGEEGKEKRKRERDERKEITEREVEGKQKE